MAGLVLSEWHVPIRSRNSGSYDIFCVSLDFSLHSPPWPETGFIRAQHVPPGLGARVGVVISRLSALHVLRGVRAKVPAWQQ